ncbi:MAG: hypothetical protein ACFFDN_30565, partial [Candidatus Hodarchaeota archaeon]
VDLLNKQEITISNQIYYEEIDNIIEKEAWNDYRNYLFKKYLTLYDFNPKEINFDYIPWLPEFNQIKLKSKNGDESYIKAKFNGEIPYKWDKKINNSPKKYIKPISPLSILNQIKGKNEVILHFYLDGRNMPSYFLKKENDIYICLTHESPVTLKYIGLYNERTARDAYIINSDNNYVPILGDVIGIEGSYEAEIIPNTQMLKFNFKSDFFNLSTVLIHPKIKSQEEQLEKGKGFIKAYMNDKIKDNVYEEAKKSLDSMFEIKDNFFEIICTRF